MVMYRVGAVESLSVSHPVCTDFFQANLIQADIESAMLDFKGGKVKKRPDALK